MAPPGGLANRYWGCFMRDERPRERRVPRRVHVPAKRKQGGTYSREQVAALLRIPYGDLRWHMRGSARFLDFPSVVLFCARHLVRQGYLDDEVKARWEQVGDVL
jgi:hypothetical protein